MCGIAGIVYMGYDNNTYIHGKYERNKKYKDLFEKLLTRAQSQGIDATGIFSSRKTVMTKDAQKIDVFKNNVAATAFLQDPTYTKNFAADMGLDGTYYVMGHCRGATSGSASNNYNNHPFICGDVVGIHNGIIHNHKKVAYDNHLSMKGQCDSEVIFSTINQGLEGNLSFEEAVQDASNELDGWYACAVVNSKNNKEICLFRNGGPFSIYEDIITRALIVASRDEWIVSALKDLGLFDNNVIKRDLQNEKGVIIDCHKNCTWNECKQFGLSDTYVYTGTNDEDKKKSKTLYT